MTRSQELSQAYVPGMGFVPGTNRRSSGTSSLFVKTAGGGSIQHPHHRHGGSRSLQHSVTLHVVDDLEDELSVSDAFGICEQELSSSSHSSRRRRRRSSGARRMTPPALSQDSTSSSSSSSSLSIVAGIGSVPAASNGQLSKTALVNLAIVCRPPTLRQSRSLGGSSRHSFTMEPVAEEESVLDLTGYC